jgi:hypothetical protein
MKNNKLKIFFAVPFAFIAIRSNSQTLDSLPGDPCPPRTGQVEVKVYPQPTTGKFKLDVGDCGEINNTLLVFDNTGKLVGSYFTPSAVADLNLHHLSKGIYYIRIINSKRTVTTRIILL